MSDGRDSTQRCLLSPGAGRVHSSLRAGAGRTQARSTDPGLLSEHVCNRGHVGRVGPRSPGRVRPSWVRRSWASCACLSAVPLQLGSSITPEGDQIEALTDLVPVAETSGLDFVTVQDHADTFLDSWTLI